MSMEAIDRDLHGKHLQLLDEVELSHFGEQRSSHAQWKGDFLQTSVDC